MIHGLNDHMFRVWAGGGLRGTSRPEKIEPRVKFQDFDPHVTLSCNGSLSVFSVSSACMSTGSACRGRYHRACVARIILSDRSCRDHMS